MHIQLLAELSANQTSPKWSPAAGHQLMKAFFQCTSENCFAKLQIKPRGWMASAPRVDELNTFGAVGFASQGSQDPLGKWPLQLLKTWK